MPPVTRRPRCSGGFGASAAGLQLSPFFDTVHDLDPRSAAEFGSATTVITDDSLIAAVFMPNAVSCTSSDIAGFQVAGLYSLGGVAGSLRTGLARDGVCPGSGLSVESGGSGGGGLQGPGTAAAGQGMPPGTTAGADVGIRVVF